MSSQLEDDNYSLILLSFSGTPRILSGMSDLSTVEGQSHGNAHVRGVITRVILCLKFKLTNLVVFRHAIDVGRSLLDSTSFRLTIEVIGELI